jgi:hypothetical protein
VVVHAAFRDRGDVGMVEARRAPRLEQPVADRRGTVGGTRGIDSIASVALRVSIASQVIVAALLPIRRCSAKWPKARAGDEERIGGATADGIAGRRSCLIGA